MEPHRRTSRRARLEVECLEQRDTPSSLSVGLGDPGPIVDATLTMCTGAPGADGQIDGRAALQSGVGGTIFLGSGRQ